MPSRAPGYHDASLAGDVGSGDRVFVSLDQLREFEAVVFDMDGVLVDSEPLHLEALNRVIALEGHHLTREDNNRFVGASVKDTWELVHAWLRLADAPEQYHGRYDQAILTVLRASRLEPFPGVRELLLELRADGTQVGLATQSHGSWVEATLDGLGMRDAFQAVVSGEMVRRGKPDPELYLSACALLAAEPTRSLAIEDSITGARAARAAGMTVVGVRNEYAGEALANEVDLVVDRVDQLLGPEVALPRPAANGGISRARAHDTRR